MDMNKKYCEYLKINESFDDCMNQERLNSTPEKWLGFYPHETFVKLLQTIVSNLTGGNKSVWLSGPYGTGKSHAALVLQKLFMDDDERVERWFERRSKQIPESVANGIRALRTEKVFVIFDSGCDAANPNAFLARMESTTIKALKDYGGKVPTLGSVDVILERVEQEGKYFFDARDRIQSQLEHLSCDITTYEELSRRMKSPKLQAGLLNDIMLVLHERSIYLNLTSENLLKWMDDIREANGFSKIVFIWDELSEYIDKNSNQLVTFQEIAEAAQGGHFFLIPVTHTQLQVFKGTGAENATKVSNRFDSVILDMPTNTALQLAADALEVTDTEWEKDRAPLWHSIKPLISGYMAERDDDCRQYPDSFQGILPLHPMTAFLLKFLSTSIGANQRSMFSFLRSKNNDSEFQKFIQNGGPTIPGRQFLTVDYLWHYFIERDDLGTAKEVYEVRIEFANKSNGLSENEKRVFKTVLLYSLLVKKTDLVSSHELIQPTVDNIKRCFDGDGNVQDVGTMLKELEKKHCFSIINNRCEMFHSAGSSVDVAKQKEKLQSQFQKQMLEAKTQPKLESRIKGFKDKLHFEVRASTPEAAGLICQQKKELFSITGNQVLIQFIVAHNAEEHSQTYAKAIELAKRSKDYRMLFVVMPELHFSSWNTTNWDEYVEELAHKELATDIQTKTNYDTQLRLMEDEWHRKLIRPDQKLQIIRPNPLEGGEPFTEERNWNTLEAYLKERLKEWFVDYLDDLSGYNMTAMLQSGKDYQRWAMAGIDFTTAVGAQKNVVLNFEKLGIANMREWFDRNPGHPLTHLRDFCKDKLTNAINGSTGTCSLRKIFIDLQRPPYGLLGVGFSAFVMGFAMKEWLDNSRQQLQWTDNVQSSPLDAQTLAEMIATVVKDDGANAIRNEKKLCRLSKEEKKFIECAPVMFGIGHVVNANIENTLQSIAERLQKVSGKAPLWVLPDYINAKGDVNAENLNAIILDLCVAEKISSKGETQKRMEFIKDIGSRLMATDGLAELLSKYVTTEVFGDAFRMMVDSKKPQLRELAESIGDKEGYYCQALKEHLVETSSWLWNQVDVDDELEILEAKYSIIDTMQGITGNNSFIEYQSVLESLKNAMERNNRISLETLGNEYPELNNLRKLLDAQNAGDGIMRLAQFMKQQSALLKELFFDPSFTIQLRLLRKLFGRQLEGIGEEELATLYDQLSVGSLRTDDDFKKTALMEIESYHKDSLGTQLKTIWKNKTGSDTPSQWCEAHVMPVEVLFEQSSLVNEIIPVLNRPEAFQSSVLDATIVKLDAAVLTPEKSLSAKFIQIVMPGKYASLNLDVGKLLVFLREHLNAHPENWLKDNAALRNAIDRFIREFYSTGIKKEVVAKARSLSDAEAKVALLKLLESTPEAGMDFLNL